MGSLDGRCVIVTGATGGLGGAVGGAFLEAGARVGVPTRDEKSLAPLLEQAGERRERLHGEVADVLSLDGFTRFVGRLLASWNRLDALIHLLGGFAYGPSMDRMDEATWDRMMNLNLRSAFVATRAVLPHLIERGEGSVLYVSSGAAEKGPPRMGPYAASKRGLISLMETTAAEVKRTRIRVNALLPSVIDTPANRRDMPDANHASWVSPEGLAAVMRFLLSDEGREIHGAAIPVSGRV